MLVQETEHDPVAQGIHQSLPRATYESNCTSGLLYRSIAFDKAILVIPERYVVVRRRASEQKGWTEIRLEYFPPNLGRSALDWTQGRRNVWAQGLYDFDLSAHYELNQD